MAAHASKEKAAPECNGVVGVQIIGRDDATSCEIEDDSSAAIIKSRLKPSVCWTKHQLFYVFILDGIGGMALSAAANFALAYPMYTVPDTKKDPVKLFALPNTLAGDAAVTIFVQCILTWFVELALLRFDMRKKYIQPIGFIPRPANRLARWWFFFPQAPSPPSEASEGSQDISPLPPRIISLQSIPHEAIRGLLLAVASFVVLWPVSVGALTAVGTKEGRDWVFDDKWAPQAFKAVLGGAVGLFTTPLMALFWLVRAGWEAEGRGEQQQTAI